MYLTYSSAFKEQALVKVYSRGKRTIQSVAEELGIKLQTLKIWMKRKSQQIRNAEMGSVTEKRSQDWRPEKQLQALHETYALTGEALNEWCRERGLFAHHLTSWKAAFCNIQTSADLATPTKRDMHDLKDENVQLKRELQRKEKALAEAAALLILQKNSRLCGRARGNDIPYRAQPYHHHGCRKHRCRCTSTPIVRSHCTIGAYATTLAARYPS